MVLAKPAYLVTLIIVLLCFAVLAFIPFGSSANPVAVRMTMDAGHLFAFVLLSGLLYLSVEHLGRWKALAIAVVISVLLIVVVELIQPYVGRTASLADMQIGLLGVFLALTGIVVWRHMQSLLLRVIHIMLVATALTLVVLPVWNEWRALWLREQQFPLLGGFEHELEKRLWQARGVANGQRTQATFSNEYVISGVHSLKVQTVKGAWSGVRYAAGDQNWLGYQALSIDLYNPGEAFNLNIRIDDGVIAVSHYNDRYNGLFKIRHGESTLLIPLAKISAGPKGRALELGQIRKMTLFSDKNAQPQLFYIDNVRLIQ